MRSTVSFGRIGGIPVGAHWSALVGIVLLGQLLALTVLPTLAPGLAPGAYWLAGGVAAVAFIASLLAHELAHAIAARRAGLEVRRITLWLLGGVSELAEQPPRAGAELRIALVGPAVSLVLGGLFAGASWAAVGFGAPGLVVATLSWLATVNVVLGVFNLLPGTPLDGGRVLHGVLWWHSGDRERATRWATGAGQFVGALLAGLGFLLALNGRWDGLWLLIVGWFLTGAATTERMHEVLAGRVEGLRAGDVMTREPHVAPGWWTVQAFVDLLLGEEGPRHRVFPVVDLEGRAIGVVRLADLAEIGPAARRNIPVRQVARPHPADLVLGPDAPLGQVLDRPLVAGRDLVLVEQDGRVVGIITPADLARTVELGALRTEHPGDRGSRPGGRAAPVEDGVR
ncbi:site-2 protease family protein [Pseudonocardia sp. H11422]|uniref:site-2 protease family protein n=1 Tax=Pseudonocardia sp. H11422 TaxID=2835866 RepID=UPI001BDDC58B|nr:site-2 protease family protein [Pseudonocardia sp. H11422]